MATQVEILEEGQEWEAEVLEVVADFTVVAVEEAMAEDNI